MAQHTSRNDHLAVWCIWKVVTPFVIVVVLWPMYSLFTTITNPYTKAFEHGDLLIFAALLFVEAAIETSEARKQNSPISKWIVEGSKAVALIMMAFFAGIKMQMAQNPLPDDQRLWAFATFSVSSAILAILVALWALLKVSASAATQELQSVSADQE